MKPEIRVGILVVATAVVLVLFGWLIGIKNPFQATQTLYLTYHFAGGIEVGSPVRVSGIKVGRVEKIEFFSEMDAKSAPKEPGSPEDELEGKEVVPVKLRISIRNDAARGIREDSKFYINLAGIIGERYIEITPGSKTAKPLKAGAVVAGVDPPRIDQLISQSFNLAGKIMEIIEENKGDLSRSIELLYKLSGQLNQTLSWVEKSKLFKSDLSRLIQNLTEVTEDVKKLTAKAHTPEGKKTLNLLYELIQRLEPLDQAAVQKFLQKEGIRARIF